MLHRLLCVCKHIKMKALEMPCLPVRALSPVSGWQDTRTGERRAGESLRKGFFKVPAHKTKPGRHHTGTAATKKEDLPWGGRYHAFPAVRS